MRSIVYIHILRRFTVFLQHRQNGYLVRTCKFLSETCKFLQDKHSQDEGLSCKSLVSRIVNLKELANCWKKNLQGDASPCKFLPETCKFLKIRPRPGYDDRMR